jgi:NAD(P)-dependent dehydrogenase (short-subunit alcohol dehydrogenase family)
MEEKPFGVQVTEIDPGEIRTGIVRSTRMAEIFREGKSLYPEVYEEYGALVEKLMSQAPTPESVAEVVWKAVIEPRTKRHYLVNRGSRLTRALRWLLPSATWEWILGRVFKWSRFPENAEMIPKAIRR